MQDTSTQAMTEVALGLSMAFFALLVLALISISVPSKDDGKIQQAHTIPPNELLEVNSSSHSKSERSAGHSPQILVLYWEGQYFDLQKNSISINDVFNDIEQSTNKKELVLAVPASTNLHQLLDIQSTFSNRDIKLTKLTTEWEAALTKRHKK